MDLSKKYPFERKKALETCYAYYKARGYSDKHCQNCANRLDDTELEHVYDIICEEIENARKKGFQIL